KKLNLKRTYRVATHTYVAAICTSPRKDAGRNLNVKTEKMTRDYLQHCGHINYAGICRVKRRP
ncbi:MAG: hypothetical protein IJ775_06765, partial [Muribaculaceae bacterium]|nr:hypothetical protein [Muribaculaceae bacterium]